jgi:hypothetical protein
MNGHFQKGAIGKSSLNPWQTWAVRDQLQPVGEALRKFKGSVARYFFVSFIQALFLLVSSTVNQR